MSDPTPIDDLLKILVCPKSKGELELVQLPAPICRTLEDRFREHFQDEDPVVEQGLHCADSALVYPIVSEIPIMLIDEAIQASDLEA